MKEQSSKARMSSGEAKPGWKRKEGKMGGEYSKFRDQVRNFCLMVSACFGQQVKGETSQIRLQILQPQTNFLSLASLFKEKWLIRVVPSS